MNQSEFIDNMFLNRSDVFPINPQESQFHMNLNGRIYVFLENAWAEVEDMKIDFINEDPVLDEAWEKIIIQSGFDKFL